MLSKYYSSRIGCLLPSVLSEWIISRILNLFWLVLSTGSWQILILKLGKTIFFTKIFCFYKTIFFTNYPANQSPQNWWLSTSLQYRKISRGKFCESSELISFLSVILLKKNLFHFCSFYIYTANPSL